MSARVKLDRAIEAVTKAKQDGAITPKESVWLLAAWASFVAEIAYDLADPFSPVDRVQAEALLREGYSLVAGLVDDVPMPLTARWLWATIKPAVPTLIPSVVGHVAEILDAGEVHDV